MNSHSPNVTGGRNVEMNNASPTSPSEKLRLAMTKETFSFIALSGNINPNVRKLTTITTKDGIVIVKTKNDQQ